MQQRFLIGSLAAAGFLVLSLALAPHAVAQSSDVARGKYLVGPAGQCADCHGAKLQGAPLDFLKPKMPVAYKSVKIAGLPHGWTATQTAHFLETGLGPDGKRAQAPMPQYRFNHADATAIVAYLQSLH